MAGFWAVISALVSYVFSTGRPKDWWPRIQDMGRAFRQAGSAMITLAVLGAGTQIVISLVGLTGLSVATTGMVTATAKTSIIAALALTAVATIILGMGLPVTAAYVVAVAVLGGSFIGLGVNLLNAHMFVFYFAVLAAITPPVCGAVYVALPISGSKLWPTAWKSVTLAIAAYIMAFLLALDSRLLMQGEPFSILVRFIITLIAILCVNITARAYLLTDATAYERILFMIATAGLLLWDLLGIPTTLVAFVGFGSLAVGLASHYLRYRKARRKVLAMAISNSDNSTTPTSSF